MRYQNIINALAELDEAETELSRFEEARLDGDNLRANPQGSLEWRAQTRQKERLAAVVDAAREGVLRDILERFHQLTRREDA